MNSLGYKTSIGVVWKFLEQILHNGVNALVTIVLAWFLIPEDFGVIAMMAVFMALSRKLVDAGFKQALIRKEEISRQDLNTAFFCNLLLSVVAYAALYKIAPYASAFYEEPRLTNLIRIAALGVIFHALSLVQQAILNRRLNFQAELKVSLPAAVLSGILAVVLAYRGFGVWALVAQIVAAPFLTTILYWRLGLWKPSLSVSLESLRELFGFGGYLLVSQVTNVLFRHMYLIVIAKLFSAAVAGLYFFADKIKELVITQIVNSIEHVTYPSLSKIQHDDVKLKDGYRSVLSVTTFLLFPTVLFLAALAEPLFSALLPDKWLHAAAYLQLMCLAALMNPLNSLNLNILNVKGRSDLVLYIGIYKTAMAVFIFFTALRFGIVAILIGQIITSIIAYIPNSYYSAKLINYSIGEQVSDFMPNFLLSSIVAALVFAAQYWLALPPIIELVGLSVFAAGMFILGAYICGLSSLPLALGYLKRLTAGS